MCSKSQIFVEQQQQNGGVATFVVSVAVVLKGAYELAEKQKSWRYMLLIWYAILGRALVRFLLLELPFEN